MTTRLNLGCGDRLENGWDWINVDMNSPLIIPPDGFVTADFRTLQWKPESVSEIQLIHAIEHISRADAMECFRRWFGWLKPGGKLVIETPCRTKCLKLLHPYQNKREGAKGIYGGRSENKKEWAIWLYSPGVGLIAGNPEDYRNAWLDHVPERFKVDGENHLYVWSGSELSAELDRIGYHSHICNPQHHGKRVHRDCRIVAVKLEESKQQ